MTSRKILVMMIYACITQQGGGRYNELNDFRLQKPLVNDNNYHFPLFEDAHAVSDVAQYMIERFFSKEKNHQIDMHFITAITKLWHSHIEELITHIDSYTTTFTLMQMDPMDQALLLAGGMEYLAHQTPKEVLINEMIEIAKRYGDDSSPKLINGIGHGMIEELSKIAKAKSES